MSININKSKTNITFNDVIGYKQQKDELKEIKNFFLNRKKYEEIGARVPKGVLLLGEAGCGKTMMAKALISEIDINTFIFGHHKDTSIDSLKEIFSEARNKQPSLIFIDELEKLVSQDSGDLVGSLFLRELLIQLDGFQSNEKVVVIATANTTFGLPPSLFRSGRFDKKIKVSYPNKEDRIKILKHYAKNTKVSPDLNYELIANMTSNLSGADIANIVNDASLMAVRNERDEITTEEISTSIDRILFGYMGREVSPEIKYQIAAHEAGHLLTAILLDSFDLFTKVSLASGNNILGYSMFSTNELLFGTKTKTNFLTDISILLGGRIAEKLLCGDISTGSSSDLNNARNISIRIIVSGMMEIEYVSSLNKRNELPEYKLAEIYKASDDILKRKYDLTYKLLSENISLLKTLTNELINKNTLYKDDVLKILENEKSQINKEKLLENNISTYN